MTTQEIKKYIYDNHKIDYVLEKIGCKEIKFHDDYYSACNIDGDNQTAINVFNEEFLGVKDYTREKFFNNKISDIFTLIQYNLGIMKKRNGFYDAIVFLHDILGIEIEKSYVKEENHECKKSILDIFTDIKELSNHSYDSNLNELKYIECEDYIPYEHISFLRQGITNKTAKKFGLCYSFNSKRTMIPLRYWINGKLLGYNGRSSIDDCDKLGIRKYIITKHYPKSINLYGLWENKESIEKMGYVTVFEAEKSVLKRDSLLDCSCVALQGHVMSNEQVRIINGLGVREVIIAMDKDVELEEIFDMCEKFYGTRMVSFIHDTKNLLGAKDSPADASDEVYRELFKNRILYGDELHRVYMKMIEKRKRRLGNEKNKTGTRTTKK